MSVTTWHRKVQTNTMKAYQKQQQFMYHYCELCHVTPENALVIAVCILMLPMVQLTAEHAQLATTYHMTPADQWLVHRHHITFCHNPLVLSSLSNVLPMMVLQNSIVSSFPLNTSSHFSVCHTPSSLHLNLLPDLGREVVLVLVLLLLLSGDIETNPGPVGQEDLKSLHSELHPVVDKWYSLGVQLQIPVETLKCIEAEHNQMNRRLLEMLTVWLRHINPSPTWDILTEALESPPVGEKLLAQQLRDKYCPNTESGSTHGYPFQEPTHADAGNSSAPDSTPTENTHPNPNTVLLDKPSVKQQVKKLEKRFSDLVDFVYRALLRKNTEDNVRYFRSSFLSLDVSRKQEHHNFIHEQLMKMDREATFDEIWEKLTDYWNFLNFDLLEYIVDKFDIDHLKQKMESYEHDLQSFRKATRLCDFIYCWPVQGETPPETELREFVAKMKHDWDNCTLEDLESLKGVITRKFFLPEFALLLKQIKEGCVVITWLIPAPFVKALQEAIKITSNLMFFIEHNIETITIDEQCCYPSLEKSLGYLQEPSFIHHQVSITPPMPTEALHPVKPDMSEEETTTLLDLKGCLPTHLGDTRPVSDYPSRGFGYASSGKYVREECVDEISQQVKLLPSLEQYLSKAEVEADPSLPTKYNDYLSSTPAIRAALYTSFNAKMSAEVFSSSQHTKSSPPTTMTELLTAFTFKALVDHLSTHPVYYKQQLKVNTFSDFPINVYKQFQALCRMAYEGILNWQQLVFSAAHLPTGFSPLGLMQEVPEGKGSCYHFIHLSLQEYLAAIHISQLPAHEQTRLVQEHLDNCHFKMTIRFLAGLTKLANILFHITTWLMKSDYTKLSYFHFLFEAEDISVTTTTLSSNEMIIASHYSWTPLDYYVTGHAISHSKCSWRLLYSNSSINDEKFELFCQGCAATGGTGCSGHISYANFSNNGVTYKSIQSFVNIPTHILQDMRVLTLYHNKLDRRACDLLAKAVQSMSRLEELWLGLNPIESGGAVEVIRALCGSEVKGLWLNNTGIGVPDCEALCELLRSSNSLKRLDIEKNNLSSTSVASIITGLSHNSSLTKLDISNSKFSMMNVDSLASIVKNESKCMLTQLLLQGCHISGQGACELAAAFCKNSTLKILELDHNPIGVKGAFSMSDVLQHNTSLEWLHLCDDSVGKEGVHQLINSLKRNQALRLPKKYKTPTFDRCVKWV